MNSLKMIGAALLALSLTACANMDGHYRSDQYSAASAQEAPDALTRRFTEEFFDTIKSSRNMPANASMSRLFALIEKTVVPYFDFERMASLAVDRFWSQATPEQKKELTTEVRKRVISMYSIVLMYAQGSAQVDDQKIEYKTLRADPAGTKVEVRLQNIPSNGDPSYPRYYLEKLPSGWKIVDVNPVGTNWLAGEDYRNDFGEQITKVGIDGLIKSLSSESK